MLVTTTPRPGDYSLNSLPITPWGILPNDVLVTIFKELDRIYLREVLNLVSREWYVISSSDAVWRQHVNSSMQPPHLKYQLKCQLGFAKIYSVIRRNLTIEESNEQVCGSFCKLIYLLFKENIFTITKKYLGRFELILNKTRQLNFEYKNITQILIPKKVCFNINRTHETNGYEQSFNFMQESPDQENPIKIYSSFSPEPTVLYKIEWTNRFSTFKFISHAPNITKRIILPEILFNPSSVQDC